MVVTSWWCRRDQLRSAILIFGPNLKSVTNFRTSWGDKLLFKNIHGPDNSSQSSNAFISLEFCFYMISKGFPKMSRCTNVKGIPPKVWGKSPSKINRRKGLPVQKCKIGRNFGCFFLMIFDRALNSTKSTVRKETSIEDYLTKKTKCFI